MSLKYSHIIGYLQRTPLALEPRKLEAIALFLADQANGIKYSAEEVQAKISPNTINATARKQGTVQVIPVQGLLTKKGGMDMQTSETFSSTERIGRIFTDAVNNPEIKAIVLDVNSPGGEVYGVQELADTIFAARESKPIIASVNALAASAAYWIASAAGEIAVTPSGEVGSIGVYTMHLDQSAFLAAEGLTPTLISAGKYKVEANPFQPLSEEARAAIQADIDAYYKMFTDAVARGRGVSSAEVRGAAFGEGRTVLAKNAVAQGMADRVETLDETLRRLGVDSGSGKSSSGKSRARALCEVEFDYLTTIGEK